MNISSKPVAMPSERLSKMLYSNGPRRIGLGCGWLSMRARSHQWYQCDHSARGSWCETV